MAFLPALLLALGGDPGLDLVTVGGEVVSAILCNDREGLVVRGRRDLPASARRKSNMYLSVCCLAHLAVV